ncbi:glycosyl hydrolase 108 family protein [Desulfobulbus sp.]|uniref:glycosyl hydrolase 108 family protein n=1 Tax=Desulfobulbus sp. TaxID=895 RepID=UPI00286F2E9C|nr:glycosyl hydrolase 108 family protein [Desulfobulbus sp.]
MSFDKAFAVTMASEGGYGVVDGHETYMGIDRTKHSNWHGWVIIDDCLHQGKPLSAQPDLADLVREFYRDEFWMPLRCHQIDQLNEAVAEELFESSVNCGPGNGVKFLQKALNVLNLQGKLYRDLKVDGVVGSKTIDAIRVCLRHRPARRLVKCQNGEQYLHYTLWPGHEKFSGVFDRT